MAEGKKLSAEEAREMYWNMQELFKEEMLEHINWLRSLTLLSSHTCDNGKNVDTCSVCQIENKLESWKPLCLHNKTR